MLFELKDLESEVSAEMTSKIVDLSALFSNYIMWLWSFLHLSRAFHDFLYDLLAALKAYSSMSAGGYNWVRWLAQANHAFQLLKWLLIRTRTTFLKFFVDYDSIDSPTFLGKLIKKFLIFINQRIHSTLYLPRSYVLFFDLIRDFQCLHDLRFFKDFFGRSTNKQGPKGLLIVVLEGAHKVWVWYLEKISRRSTPHHLGLLQNPLNLFDLLNLFLIFFILFVTLLILLLFLLLLPYCTLFLLPSLSFLVSQLL